MFLLEWYKQWKEIKNEYPSEAKPCESCETLKMQLGIANNEKRTLLDRLLEKPTVESQSVEPSIMKPILTGGHRSFGMRRQMLEREDREKAKLLKQNSEIPKIETNELEAELLAAGEARMNEATNAIK